MAMETENRAPNLTRLTASTLLLWGSKSPDYFKRSLDALGRALPHAKRVHRRGLDHVGPSSEGKPRLIAPELMRFFTSAVQT